MVCDDSLGAFTVSFCHMPKCNKALSHLMEFTGLCTYTPITATVDITKWLIKMADRSCDSFPMAAINFFPDEKQCFGFNIRKP